MSSGIIPILDDILQTLPPNSPEADKLRLVIVALTDALPLHPDIEYSKLVEELAAERRRREQAEQHLARRTAELERLRSGSP
jgi:hypothetical protein